MLLPDQELEAAGELEGNGIAAGGQEHSFPPGQGHHATQGLAMVIPRTLSLDPKALQPGKEGMGAVLRQELWLLSLSGPTHKTQAHLMGFKFFFVFLNSLVPDGGLAAAPPQCGYSSERRSILRSSTSNTRVAPPAGEKWGQAENQGHRETGWAQETGDGRWEEVLPGILGGAPRSPYPVKDAQRNKVSCGQAKRRSADIRAEARPLPSSARPEMEMV